MAISEVELEQRLLEDGKELLSPPSSVSDIIASLDRVENLLALVEQSPSESMKRALEPSTKALIAENLLRHPDVDVKVAVASCISEITRITAPDAPYEDDQMKEVFQLIVSSFEKLDDRSSRSYVKRNSILETVAKVRSCVVMLDLECDALIVEMFRHFVKSIRDDLHENVLPSMETIMTLVVEESEDISQDLLLSILDVLKKENKEVRPVARQLVETVITKCARKLKPYILQAVRTSGGSFDDYIKAVAEACRDGSEAVEVTNDDSGSKNLVDGNELVLASEEKAVEVGMETLKDAPCSEEAGPSVVGSPKTFMSNGTLQKETEDSSAGIDNSKDAGHDAQYEEAEPSIAIVDTEVATKLQTKSGRSNRRKGRKPHSTKSSEPTETTVLDIKDADMTLERQENDVKDVDNIQSDEPMADATVPEENEIAAEVPVSPSKTSVNVPSPNPDESLAEETRSKKVGRGKKNEDSSQDGLLVKVDSKMKSGNKKAGEKSSGSKNKVSNHTDKKSTSASDGAKSGPDLADEKKEGDSANESGGESELDVKEKAEDVEDVKEKTEVVEDVKEKTEVVEDKEKTEVEGKQREVKKKRGQAKTTTGKAQAKPSLKDETTKTVAKNDSDAEDASKSNSKRKRSSIEKVPKTKVYGAELVGSAVQVWWPDDNKYYTGVVDSYDSVKKRHKVLYDDGDVEVLNLKNEDWKVIPPSLPEQTSEGESPDGSADEMPKGKKTKTSVDQGAKHGKTVGSSKKSGASSSKAKATPKTGSKQEDGKKSGELEESSNKSGTDKGGKSTSKSGNKSSVKKSKDNDADSVKDSNKSKLDAPKSAAKSKNKSAKGGSKLKADPVPMEVSEDESQSLGEEKTPEKSKGKSQSTPKSQKNSKRKKNVKA